MGKSGGVKCAIKSCRSVSSNNYNGSIRFFRFPNPRHEIQINQWKLTCSDDTIMMSDNEKLYRSKRICSLHFEEHMMKKYQLKKDAVPTLNLEISSATSLYEVYEEHSYFRDENLEVGHYIEIDDLKKDAVPTSNLEESSAISLYEDHSYFRDQNFEAGHYMDIDNCSVPDYRMNVESRSIGIQTASIMVNMGTQTSYINKSDCQIQTEMKLSKNAWNIKTNEKIEGSENNYEVIRKGKCKTSTFL